MRDRHGAGPVCSISADGLDELLTRMRAGHRTLTSGLQPLRAQMRAGGVTLDAFRAIDRIADWVDDQLLMLERRRNMAIALTSERPSWAPARLSDLTAFQTPGAAERHGRHLADRLLAATSVTSGFFDELMNGFAPYVTDPDVMAGFYLQLGPWRAERLADQLVSTGHPRAARYLEAFSTGLGTALRTADDADGTTAYYTDLAPFRQHFTQPVADPRNAWGRMAILQHGDFPPGWLADAVGISLLDHLMAGDTHRNTFLHSPHTHHVGLPSSALAVAFAALANNPAAARLAMSKRSGHTVAEYVDRVFELDDGYASAATTSFGRALAAGAGALGAPPGTGRHAASFAFDTIVALGRYEAPPATMSQPMGRIAAVYAEELLVGSYEHAPSHLSSMAAHPDFGAPAGTDPRFFLNPDDVYRFLHGFARTDADSTEFDEAVRDLYQTLPGLALDADLAKSTTERERFAQVLRMFGTLAGLQYQARRDVRGEEYERRHATWDAFTSGWSLLGLISTEVKNVVSIGWKLIQLGAGNIDGPGTDPRHELDDRHREAGVLQRGLLAITMVEGGYPHTVDLPAGLLDADGELRAADEILEDRAEGGLAEQLIDWAHSNTDRHPDHDGLPSFDSTFSAAWDALGNGRNDASVQVVDRVEW